MGEYARDDIMRRFGVDIGDDSPDRPYRPRRVPCPGCGKLFRTAEGVTDHLRDVHGITAAAKVKGDL